MKCNLDTHICGAESGSTLLQLMVFTSNGCNGCDQEGVTMILTGSDNERPMPQCKTKDLDHPNVPEFSKGQTTFVAKRHPPNYCTKKVDTCRTNGGRSFMKSWVLSYCCTHYSDPYSKYLQFFLALLCLN